jgi:hypothetical protein
LAALKIDRILASQGDFQPVIAKAREIEALSKLLKEFLPPELAPLAHVANFKDGKLSLLAANGPTAAKLKLLSESLGGYISKQRTQVNSVSVRVQPSFLEAYEPVEKHALLTPAALQELVALHSRIPDSPFRKALKSLLDRNGLSPRQP